MQSVGTEPVFKSLYERRLQIPSVNRVLRPLVAGMPAERLPVDELAEAVEEHRLLRLDGDTRERRLEAKAGQYLRRVRQQVDANADRLDLGGRLEDAAGNFPRMQLERQRQAAD